MAVHRTRLNASGASLRAGSRGCALRERSSGRGPLKRRGPLPECRSLVAARQGTGCTPPGPTFISRLCWELPAAPHAWSPAGTAPPSPLRSCGRRGSPAAPTPTPRGCPESPQTAKTRQPLPSFPNPCPKPRGESAGSTCRDEDEDWEDAGRAAHLSSSRRPGSATTYWRAP